jgi:hypothetical protein
LGLGLARGGFQILRKEGMKDVVSGEGQEHEALYGGGVMLEDLIGVRFRTIRSVVRAV